LLIKKYEKGKVTPILLDIDHDCNAKVVLSCGKGAGMKFDTLLSGKVIIVAGGTGLFPFIDFIDILFKNALVL
jgi:NAD(P)H-flavin reductase